MDSLFSWTSTPITIINRNQVIQTQFWLGQGPFVDFFYFYMPVFFEMTSSFYPTTLPLLDSLTSTLCHMHCPSNRIITTMPEAEYCNKVTIMRTLFPSLDCGQFTTLEHKLKNALISVCLIVILSLTIVMPSYINASSNPPVLFRKGSSSYVIPYSEWLKNSWLWWIGIRGLKTRKL
jgi:hypothetical protein